MSTIRTKLALFFTGFSVLLVLAGILMNALFLESFYILRNRRLLSDMADRVAMEYARDRRSAGTFIEALDRSDGVNIVITDSARKILLDSLPRSPGTEASRLPSEIEPLFTAPALSRPGGVLYRRVSEPADQPAKLVYIKQTEAGGFIILRKSMKGIQESVSIANGFYLYAGLVIVLLGGLLTFLVSTRITKPIVEMSRVAEAIAGLDFSRHVTTHSRDELGTLAESINRMSEKLSANLGALRQDVDRRKSLVRNLSHELKSPIGVIKGYAEGLQHGVADDPEKARRYCCIISDECDRMDALVRDMLHLSLLESGTFRATPVSFDVGMLFRSIADRFEPAIRDKGITLRIHSPAELRLTADRELIGQAVANYLSNAIRHAAGERQVEITAEPFHRDDGAAMCRIRVTNTGAQIPDSALPVLWDAFYKVDRARSRADGGHGIGLSIVREIVLLHGGCVRAENRPDGVAFIAEIPLEPFT